MLTAPLSGPVLRFSVLRSRWDSWLRFAAKAQRVRSTGSVRKRASSVCYVGGAAAARAARLLAARARGMGRTPGQRSGSVPEAAPDGAAAPRGAVVSDEDRARQLRNTHAGRVRKKKKLAARRARSAAHNAAKKQSGAAGGAAAAPHVAETPGALRLLLRAYQQPADASLAAAARSATGRSCKRRRVA